ncbi:hypothetical protein BU23DRAFT_480009 [Bimuria novae-zelandiae CBS 107.79]|uniref:Concanavalin A-like lectin/glucanase n=1 Tax=Bimuria novae-zelandiae CBS 107.79 TaxID=1447943 RepID=A0A6A5UUY5_9PLEO|nr:hypothetical protein BU23DRAFT_480009 [Bimuria novae-zelandiae CBS 107.79]
MLPVASAQYFSFGDYFSTGPVASNSWIRQATTTLVLPALNSPHNGNLGLWPGMGTKFDSGADGHLVQGLAISTHIRWYSLPYTWEIAVDSQPSIGEQHDGTPYRANPGDKVTYDYKYNDSTAKFDQTVSVNGVKVSTLSTSTGHGAGWGTAMECQQANCGTVPEHHYINTKIILNTADPNYKNTLGLNGASGNLVTADGGKTWTVADIKINKYTFT